VPLAVGFVVTLAVNVLFGALLLAIEIVRRGALAPVDPFGFGAFVLAGLCSTFLARWLFYACVEAYGPARASLFQLTSPLVTAVLSFALLGERLSGIVVAAMVAVTVGLAIVATSPRDLAAPVRSARRFAAFGLGAGASVGYAIGNVLRGLGISHWNEAIAGTLVGAVAALALQLVLTALSREGIRPVARADRRGLALYATIGVTTLSAQVLTIAAMALAPVALVALITLSTPMLVLPFSLTVLRREERIGARMIAGTMLAVGGMAVIILR
jgi:drug/metabolite transporter (DMT)-like permease